MKKFIQSALQGLVDRAFQLWQRLPLIASVCLGLLLLAFLLAFLFGRSGGPLPDSFVQEPNKHIDIFISSYFDSETTLEEVAARGRLESIQLGQRASAVVLLRGLKPGRNYTATCSIIDSAGTPIPIKLPPFTPEGEEYFWNLRFQANPNLHRPGKWTAVFSAEGLGELRHGFNVLEGSEASADTTPATAEANASAPGSGVQSGAMEALQTAFSHYWAAHAVPGGSLAFLTKLTATGEAVAGQSGEAYEAIQGLELLKKIASQESPDAEVAYLNISAVPAPILFSDPVTEADRLNGIAARVSAAVQFKVFRLYYPEQGWTKWIDLSRPSSEVEQIYANAGEASSRYLAQLMGMNLAEMDKQKRGGAQPSLLPGLRYEIIQQEGHWHVLSDQGDVFVNGKLTNDKATDVFSVRRLKHNGGLMISLPSPRLSELVLAKKAPGDFARQVGELTSQANGDPELIPQNKTVEILRRSWGN